MTGTTKTRGIIKTKTEHIGLKCRTKTIGEQTLILKTTGIGTTRKTTRPTLGLQGIPRTTTPTRILLKGNICLLGETTQTRLETGIDKTTPLGTTTRKTIGRLKTIKTRLNDKTTGLKGTTLIKALRTQPTITNIGTRLNIETTLRIGTGLRKTGQTLLTTPRLTTTTGLWYKLLDLMTHNILPTGRLPHPTTKTRTGGIFSTTNGLGTTPTTPMTTTILKTRGNGTIKGTTLDNETPWTGTITTTRTLRTKTLKTRTGPTTLTGTPNKTGISKRLYEMIGNRSHSGSQ